MEPLSPNVAASTGSEELNQQTTGKERSETAPDIKNTKNDESIAVKVHVKGNTISGDVNNEGGKPNEKEDLCKEKTDTTAQVKKSSFDIDLEDAEIIEVIKEALLYPVREYKKEKMSKKAMNFLMDKRKTLSHKGPVTEMEEIAMFDVANQSVIKENICKNCEILRSDIALLISEILDLEKKSGESREGEKHSSERASESDESETEASTSSSDADGAAGKENNWKSLCSDFKKKIKKLEEDTANQMQSFAVKITESENEKALLNEKLLKTMKEVDTMEVALKAEMNENLRLIDHIANMRNQFTKDLEKQKKELEQSTEANVTSTMELHRSSEAKVRQLEEMLKKARIDHVELRDRLDRNLDDLEHVKFGTLEPEEFRRRLKKRLSALVEKFREEATDSDLEKIDKKSIQCTLEGFEAAVKIILEDEPHLSTLANRIAVIMDDEEVDERKESFEGSPEKGFVDVEEAKALMDFKVSLSKEVHSMLQTFQNNQRDELCENIWNIMSRLDGTEQKIDNILARRVDKLNDALVVIDRKQNDFDTIKNELGKVNAGLGNLFKAIDQFRHDVEMESEKRIDDLNHLKMEKHKFKTTCKYVDYLSGEHTKLEEQVKNMETQYEQLQKEVCSSPLIDTPAMSFIGPLSAPRNEEDKVVESQVTEKSGNWSGVKKKDGQRTKSPISRMIARGTPKWVRGKRMSSKSPRNKSRKKAPQCNAS